MVSDARAVRFSVALEKARQAYARKNPHSEAMHVAATSVMPGGNTRSTLYFAPFPLAFASGDGAYLTDVDGHRYLDFMNEFTAGVFGHTNPKLLTRLSEVAANGISLGGHNPWEQKFAEALCMRFPALKMVRFTSSGTEANLFALSAARAFTRRKGIMVFRGGYHGGVLTFSNPKSLINVPHKYVVAEYNNIEATRALLEAHKDGIGSVMIEPMMSSGGCIPAAREFLIMLREVTEKHKIVLIFDEVVTSRLAPRGLHDKLGITPDLITLGKYIGGGLNAGAFGGRQDIMAQFDPRLPSSLPHAGTFNNNVLTMRSGYAAVTEVFTEQESRRLNEQGDRLRDRLNAIATQTQLPMTFTGVGAATNVHMVNHAVRSPSDLKRNDLTLRDLYYFHLLSRGIYLARRGMVNLSLPMVDDDVDFLVETTREFTEKYAPMKHNQRPLARLAS